MLLQFDAKHQHNLAQTSYNFRAHASIGRIGVPRFQGPRVWPVVTPTDPRGYCGSWRSRYAALGFMICWRDGVFLLAAKSRTEVSCRAACYEMFVVFSLLLNWNTRKHFKCLHESLSRFPISRFAIWMFFIEAFTWVLLEKLSLKDVFQTRKACFYT